MRAPTDHPNASGGDHNTFASTDERAEFSGLDVVWDALAGEDFPMDREALYYSVGDIDVPGPQGTPIPMRQLLDHLSQTSFETLGQVVTAIKKLLTRPA